MKSEDLKVNIPRFEDRLERCPNCIYYNVTCIGQEIEDDRYKECSKFKNKHLKVVK